MALLRRHAHQRGSRNRVHVIHPRRCRLQPYCLAWQLLLGRTRLVWRLPLPWGLARLGLGLGLGMGLLRLGLGRRIRLGMGLVGSRLGLGSILGMALLLLQPVGLRLMALCRRFPRALRTRPIPCLGFHQNWLPTSGRLCQKWGFNNWSRLGSALTESVRRNPTAKSRKERHSARG